MESDKYDTYWRLNSYKHLKTATLRELLNEAGYIKLMTAPKYELVDLKHLIDRGQINYVQCRLRQLVDFVEQRGLEAEGPQNRYTLTRCLQRADAQLSFLRFTQLPAELRSRIYAFYFAEFAEVLTLPSQPPLARASRQLRLEALPLFHATKTFRLVFAAKGRASGEKKGLIWPTDPTARFLHELPASSLAEMRSLVLDVQDGESRHCTARIDYSVLRRKWELAFDFGPRAPSNSLRTRERHVKGIHRVLARMTARRGSGRLRREDVYALRLAMEGAHK